MNDDARQVTTYSSAKYTFWFHVMDKIAFAFPWNTPKQLVKVMVSDRNINSDGTIWRNRQDILDIPLANISKIKLVISTGHIGTLEITTEESKHFALVPTNPFDPTLLSHSNVDEIMAFINVVEALKVNRTPDVNENPYTRQFLKKDKPDYLNNQIDFLWDKDVSPWEYYYQFVPADVDKKKRTVAKRYKIVVFGALSIMVLLALYAISVRFVW
jgi:hypothetical protein